MLSKGKKFAVIVTALGALIALKVNGSSPPRQLDAMKLEPRTLHPLILASGQITFAREAPLSSELLGRVARIRVREGERVESGQTLIELEPNAFAAQLEQQQALTRGARVAIERAELELANAQNDHERKQQLAAAKFLGPNVLDDSRFRVEAARVELQARRESLRQSEAALNLARENLAKTAIKSPIAGVVVAVPIRIGETAVPSSSGIPGSALVTIADTSAMHAEVLVDEAEISGVKVGQQAKVFPAGKDDLALQGRVSSVSMAPKTGTRNYLVRVTLDQADAMLRTGMSCRVELLASSRAPMLAVPLQAVQTAPASAAASAPATQVWVVEDGRARRREVSLGLSDDRMQEVRGGLRSGDQVLTGPVRALRELNEGDPVRVREGDGKESS